MNQEGSSLALRAVSRVKSANERLLQPRGREFLLFSLSSVLIAVREGRKRQREREGMGKGRGSETALPSPPAIPRGNRAAR